MVTNNIVTSHILMTDNKNISQKAALKFRYPIRNSTACAPMPPTKALAASRVLFRGLGASATVVGLVAGLGELIGYGLRLVTGYISDQTRQYWKITTLGYFINTAAVPLLALAGNWPIAAGIDNCRTHRQSNSFSRARRITFSRRPESRRGFWFRLARGG